MTWFGVVEIIITRVLADVLEFDDFEMFDLLTRGIDARVKCERLRKACQKYLPMGWTSKNTFPI